MPQPKKKHSNMRTGHRRAHYMQELWMPTLTTCPTCQAPQLAHHVCMSCMTYRGRSFGTPKAQA